MPLHRLALIAILPPLVFAPGVLAQGKIEMRGTVQKFDVDTGSLVFKTLVSKRILNLGLASKEIPVQNILGEPIKLNDVRAGQRVAITVVDEAEVSAIRVEGPLLYGTLWKLDLEGGKFYVENFLRDYEFPISKKIAVFVDLQPSSWDKLLVGKAIKIVLTPDGKGVLQVRSGKDASTRDPDHLVRTVNGLLVDISPKDQSLDVININLADPIDRATVKLKPEALVKLHWHGRLIKTVPQDHLRPLVRVQYVQDLETQLVEVIDVEVPDYNKRKIVAIEKATVTFIDHKAERKLPIAPDAKIWLQGQPGDLSQVQAGVSAHLGLSLDRETVVSIYTLGQ